jgi:hypothetical protein
VRGGTPLGALDICIAPPPLEAWGALLHKGAAPLCEHGVCVMPMHLHLPHQHHHQSLARRPPQSAAITSVSRPNERCEGAVLALAFRKQVRGDAGARMSRVDHK